MRMRTLAITLGVCVLLCLLAAGVGAFYVYSGRAAVRADSEHHRLAHWLLETTRRNAVERQSQPIEVQLPGLVGDEMLAAVAAYEEMCAVCHAPPGREPTALARGLNPPPPDLRRPDYSAKELFWVTRHGIRMTGMPAWGITHSDAALWALVALVVRFPGMTGIEYENLLAEAEAAGVEHRHDDGHDHDDHKH
jgi:hypothetical protein